MRSSPSTRARAKWLKVYLSGHPDRPEPLPGSVQRQLLKKLLGVESITVTPGADGAAVDLVVNLAGGALIRAPRKPEWSSYYRTLGGEGRVRRGRG